MSWWLPFFCLLGLVGLLLWGLFYSRRQQRQPQMNGISVVLLTRNNAANLEGVVRWLLQYEYRYHWLLQIIIIDQGSWDQTLAIADKLAREHFNLLVVEQKWFPLISPRRLAYLAARYQRVVFLDLRQRQQGKRELQTLLRIFNEQAFGT
ncbi:MAG: glycosyltransferase family 2 protein [Bacillota bacterium]|uniref:Glycosyl transferase family 2 n=2 Tax=Carboxydocella TaxID=178898 RepID=A0A1T4REJ6_9FIRM|nr:MULTISPECIES: glycosyltransferase family A protein [Carboxydocella]AVX21712.1 Glycosyl transferase family 2 [Carboxydocella thermautotrophica]SKA14450.1 Glycosyl transferase family 2 [Carboxydocella sporoproducens DSM 16521]